MRPFARFTLATLAGLLAAVAVVRVRNAYRRDLHRAEPALVGGSGVVETRCGPIEFASAGDGRTLLVVHGAGGGFDQGLALGQPLAARGFRVVAMSRFGYLRTPMPADASADAQADAHAALLDALGVARAVIIGVSAGAPSSVQFALRHPDRCAGLVLLVPAAYAPRRGRLLAPARGTTLLVDTALRSDFLFWCVRKLAPGLLVRYLLATQPAFVDRAAPEERARVASILDHLLPVSRRRRGLVNDARIVSTLAATDLERIAAPTLVIGVEDDLFDTFAAARYAVEQIAGARLVRFATGGHVWVGHQEAVLDEIAAFASAVPA